MTLTQNQPPLKQSLKSKPANRANTNLKHLLQYMRREGLGNWVEICEGGGSKVEVQVRQISPRTIKVRKSGMAQTFIMISFGIIF